MKTLLSLTLGCALGSSFAVAADHHDPGVPAALQIPKSAAAAPVAPPSHAKPADPAATSATGHAAPDHEAAAGGPSPDVVLRELKEGNLRFVSDRMVHDLISAARRAELSDGQHPTVTVLSCSDSRVPPELVFDRGLGELFTIRVAGNVADTDEIGTIEYGVGHLHTPVLLVLGHTSCGAVKAVAENASLSGSLPKLVDNIVPAVLRAKDEASTPEGVIDAAVRANVWVSIEDIFQRSEEVRQRAAAGKLRVIGAVYDLHTGIVSWMGSHPSQKLLIAGTVPTTSAAPAAAAQPKPAVAKVSGDPNY